MRYLTMKLISSPEIASSEAIKAGVFDRPLRSSKNIRTSITSANTSLSRDLGPPSFSSSMPLMHLLESLTNILMMSGLRLILKISLIERIVSSQITDSSIKEDSYHSCERSFSVTVSSLHTLNYLIQIACNLGRFPRRLSPTYPINLPISLTTSYLSFVSSTSKML